MKVKTITALLIISLLTACNGVGGKFDWRKPVALDMRAPEGPSNYQQGWTDGCTSGLASTVNSLQMTLGSYKFTLDQKLRYDKLYNVAWKYAYNHCGYSMKTLAQYNF